MKPIKTALISVYHKDNLESIIRTLAHYNVQLYSTGGTYEFITRMGVKALTVESVTGYPSILGGRVKTLHPKIFGGILSRRDHETDVEQMRSYDIPYFDLVITDLYPFEQTTRETDCEAEIIEKIDIGGISLIRAAAKNYRDVVIVPSREHYREFEELLNQNKGAFSQEERKRFAGYAFNVSSHYDMAIYQHFSKTEEQTALKISEPHSTALRYGENPHQKGSFHGKLEAIFTQLHGKALSYNNLVDIDAAISLILEFNDPTFAILKHTNACGCATRPELLSAYQNALAGDPVSAFGGVFISNQPIDRQTAEEINKLFFEVILAPGYEESALEILQSKKNRIILKKKSYDFASELVKTSLNGYIVQDRDSATETGDNLTVVTHRKPSDQEIVDLLFANKLVKHTKSNAIVLAKKEMLLGSGTGQTSRIDALKQAITKAGAFNLPLEGAVMASDAFFPFPDNVEEAWKAGIKAVIQPGGSIRDQQSIDFCNAHDMAMVFTGVRHFKH